MKLIAGAPILAMALFLCLAGACIQPSPTPLPIIPTLDCGDERFIQAILDLSQDQEVKILKIYTGAEELRHSDEILECRGEAKLSNGFDVYLVYYYEIDRDGDAFFGYLVEE